MSIKQKEKTLEIQIEAYIAASPYLINPCIIQPVSGSGHRIGPLRRRNHVHPSFLSTKKLKLSISKYSKNTEGVDTESIIQRKGDRRVCLKLLF